MRVKGYQNYCGSKEFDIDRGQEWPRSISNFWRSNKIFVIFSISSIIYHVDTYSTLHRNTICIESIVAEPPWNNNDRQVNIREILKVQASNNIRL
jgi:hypothetical protein